MRQSQLNIVKLKQTILFTIVTVSVFVTIVIYSFTYKIQDIRFESLKNDQETRLYKSINNIMESYILRYSSTLQRLVITKDIVKLFNDSKRDELYDILKPQWDIIKKENPYITVMHFHKADGKSFLRMHNKERYGDDIAKVRPMLQTIHKEHKVITGYETGLYAIVFRIIYPIFYQDRYIGALELGINPNGFIDQVNKFSSVDGVLFIKDEYLRLYRKNINIKKSGYTLQTDVKKDIQTIIEKLPENYLLLNNKTYQFKDKVYILHNVNIEDSKQNIVAKLLFFYDMTALYSTKNFFIFFIMFSLILFVLIILYLIKKQFDKFEYGITESFLELISKVIDSKQTYIDFFMNTNSANIVYKVEKDGKEFKIKALNPASEKIENISGSDVINKTALEVFPGIEKCGLYKVMCEVFQSGKSVSMPIVFYEDDLRGGYREYFVFKLSYNSLVVSYKDYTKEKAMEDEIVNNQQLMIAQSRYAAMGEMIGMIAHQWRQPISVIAMTANNILIDIALGDSNVSVVEEDANNILEQTSHLSQTIDDFRNFFKSDKIVSKIKMEDAIKETYKIVKDSLKNNNIEFNATYETDLEVSAYSRELMQVFVNIINNAKDSLVGSKIETPLITVRVYEDDSYVNTQICDNGHGIKKEILSKIFDPYYTTKDETIGTGLGLYMSKMIVEKHLNGKLEVENMKQGVCFKVRLLKDEIGIEDNDK